jgi:iron complex transport system substrate-binding protein
MRVVSLLPSATELLCRLGADDGPRREGSGRDTSKDARAGRTGRDLLVGRSHECDFPPGLEDVPVLTGHRVQQGPTPDSSPCPTRRPTTSPAPAEIDHAARDQVDGGSLLHTLDRGRLVELRPDLILTQDLRSVCSIDLQQLDPCPEVLSLIPLTIEDVFDDLLRIGRAVEMEQEASRAVVALRERMFAAADFVPSFANRPVVAFLEWTDPLSIGGHWTPQLIERAGGDHPLNPAIPIENAGAAAGPMQAERRAGKSVRISPESLVAIRPEYLVICPCGIRLDDVHRMTEALAEQPWWEHLPAVRAARAGKQRIAMVDGNQMFNRPGPRLVDAYEWLVGWLNDRPELILPEFPWRPWPH